MRHKVKLPKIGDTTTEVVILEWYVEPGAHVSAGDLLVSVETDKVDADVEAPIGGVMTEHVAKPQQSVVVGDVIAIIESQS